MSTHHLRRPGRDPISADLLRVGIAMNATVAEAGCSKRLVAARQAWELLRTEHAAAVTQYRQEAAAVRARATPVETPTPAMTAAAHRASLLGEQVRAAQVELAALTATAAPAVARDLAPHLAVAERLVQELIGLLETACDPLFDARNFLRDNGFEAIPRLVDAAPMLVQHLREMRRLVGGR